MLEFVERTTIAKGTGIAKIDTGLVQLEVLAIGLSHPVLLFARERGSVVAILQTHLHDDGGSLSHVEVDTVPVPDP